MLGRISRGALVGIVLLLVFATAASADAVQQSYPDRRAPGLPAFSSVATSFDPASGQLTFTAQFWSPLPTPPTNDQGPDVEFHFADTSTIWCLEDDATYSFGNRPFEATLDQAGAALTFNPDGSVKAEDLGEQDSISDLAGSLSSDRQTVTMSGTVPALTGHAPACITALVEDRAFDPHAGYDGAGPLYFGNARSVLIGRIKPIPRLSIQHAAKIVRTDLRRRFGRLDTWGVRCSRQDPYTANCPIAANHANADQLGGSDQIYYEIAPSGRSFLNDTGLDLHPVPAHRYCGFVANPKGQGFFVTVAGVTCARAQRVLVDEDSSRCFSPTTGAPHPCTVDRFRCRSRFANAMTYTHCTRDPETIDAKSGP